MSISAFSPFFGQRLKTNTKLSVDRGFVAHLVIEAANATAAAVNNVKTAVTLADGLTTTLTVADLTQPLVPGVLSITGVGAETAGNVVITGTDANDEVLVETIIAAGATTVVGTKAFKTLTTIVLPARGAVGNTIAIGLADKFGLPYKLAQDTVLKILNNNGATTVAAGSSFSATVLADNYIDPTAALAGNQVDVYLVV